MGTVRDAFSDLLFPGTSTLHTRAKYILFIPWIFLQRERRKTRSEYIAIGSRSDEIHLIYCLLDSGEKDGVIGQDAKDSLKILPSYMYWSGLGKWGIRRFNGSLDQYFRSLDNFYSYGESRILSDDKEPITDIRVNWDPNIIKLPKDFPKGASLELSYKEAGYLHDRILASCPESLLAFLVDRTEPTQNIPYIWYHLDAERFPKKIIKILKHSQNFSEVIQGAALLYNLMLSEKSKNQEYEEGYRNKIGKWAGEIEARFSEIDDWDLIEFWEIVREENRHIPQLTQRFIERWISIVRGSKGLGQIADDKSARKLVYDREVRIKRNRSRLKNPQMLAQWSGAAGTRRFDFRWYIVKRIVNDILDGLGRK
ncbi:hypothetical protein ES703_105286 [subsurface metagenome]